MPTGIQQALDIQCRICDELLNEGNVSSLNEHACINCEEEYIYSCDYCGDIGVSADIHHYRMFRQISETFDVYSSVQRTHDAVLCDDCVSTCADCGSIFSNEEDAIDCCAPAGGELHYYSFKPAARFWHSENYHSWRPMPDQLYMGIELEIEKVSEHVYEETISYGEDWHNPRFFYWKSDGSLGVYGAELVTHPATFSAFMRKFPFDLLNTLHTLGARSFRYESTGMHIHVSRTAFTPSHLWKFIKLQTNSSAALETFSGRNSVHWASWSGEAMEDISRETAKYVKGESQRNRYSAINFQPEYTVELRYFKGNINPDAVKRNVELVHAMYEYTKSLTVSQIIINRNALKWDSFVSWLCERQHNDYLTALDYIQNHNIMMPVAPAPDITDNNPIDAEEIPF